MEVERKSLRRRELYLKMETELGEPGPSGGGGSWKF